ncbi:diguanylate cyclase [Roseofilum sp. BLCC_M154]|uniref:Diguanylate cyclase n=1 Tax=Roseofilum acuticapitatum BLCC-M154 TaxID=3022444 RepID=A0ABT7ANS2_9CYAN|nr:diguanylate cyclase [Roseofilum acuticapitatum]MDJ1168247.1 diguanylate cyclase [Roseofilum acuticapitatum BLCC-M154]
MADRFSHPPKTLPLSIYILVPVVFPILVAMTFTGWLSLRHNHQLVKQLSLQWMQEVGNRLETRLSQDLSLPQEILKSYETLPLDEAIALSNQNCFWPLLNSFPTLEGMSIGLQATGELLAIHRTQTGDLICTQANRQTDNRLSVSPLNNQGDIQEPVKNYLNPYDIREEFWYKNSIIEDSYSLKITQLPSRSNPSVKLQLTQPLYNPQNKLLGVGKIDFNLNHFTDYIQKESLGIPADILIFNEQIKLIYSSGYTPQKQEFIDSNLRPAIQKNLQKDSPQKLHIISYNKQKYWIFSFAYHLPGQAQWWIGIIVPEKQIFQAVEIKWRNSLLINFCALLVAICLGNLLLNNVSRILNQLSEAVELAIQGVLNLKIPKPSIVYPLQRLIESAQKLIDYGSLMMGLVTQENQQLLDKVESGTNLLIEAVEKADKANLKLQQSQSLLESIINSSMDGIMAFQSLRDRQGRIIDFEWIVVNQVFVDFFNLNTADLVGKYWLQEINSPNLRSLFDHYVSVVETGQNLELEFPYDYENERAWFHMIAVKLGDGLSVNFRDVTDRKKSVFELRKMLDEVHKLANTDGLTKVANRRQFDECLYQEWLRLKRDRLPLSLILCDVDYFKLYNDTYGHQAGDECLIQVARAIQHSVRRASDMVARYGGEEFVVLLPNTSEEGAKVVAQLIQSKIDDLQIPHKTSKVSSAVTMSLGISTLIPSAELSKESLIALADEALYEAKKNGRNQFVVKS